MKAKRYKRGGFAWLELLLVLAFLALVFQIFPSLWHMMWAALDVRNWSRTVWFALNVIVVIGLFGVRFAPEIATNIHERRRQLARRWRKSRAAAMGQPDDADYEARVRRDAEWVKRAKKRMPWH